LTATPQPALTSSLDASQFVGTLRVGLCAVADVGTVVNPRSLGGQILGGSCLGIGHALTQKTVYDEHYGLPLATRFHHTKPLTILDVPAGMQHAALDIPDPETPVGARGVAFAFEQRTGRAGPLVILASGAPDARDRIGCAQSSGSSTRYRRAGAPGIRTAAAGFRA
jgi:hypothetical protein